ncbi:MAG: HAD-IA family hydrolase [Mobilicoccus sp.]|nr:HAD-IA family hydrolase [Mobilicoccus sp.]
MQRTTGRADAAISTPRRAVLIDYGGVLTTPIADAFGDLDRRCGLPAGGALRLIATDPAVRAAFVDLETGTLPPADFEVAYAEGLTRASGRAIDADGLLAGLVGRMALVPEMVDFVADLRAAGVPVALVSNSLGPGGYDAVDLEATFDVSVISGQVGVRKPSRAIYSLACDRLGVPESDGVLIDDLQQNLDGAARLDIAGVLHRTPTETIERATALLGLSGTNDGRPHAVAEGE